MKDFIIIALLGALLLASYIQYKEMRDLRKSMIKETFEDLKACKRA